MERLFIKSPNIAIFIHLGEIYLYHDFFGFNLKMSSDLLRILDAFEEPTSVDDAVKELDYFFVEEQLREFIQTFLGYSCIISNGYNEENAMLPMYPVKGPWLLEFSVNRARVRIYNSLRGKTFYEELTGWKKRLWKLIDGNSSIVELYEQISAKFKVDKSLFLHTIKKWVHHDSQLLRLSDTAISKYTPVIFPLPPYLKSTMPFKLFDRKTDLYKKPVRNKKIVIPDTYYKDEIENAEKQFDVVETTLSHLFRYPNSALAGTTYGESLAIRLKQESKKHDNIKILDIGGGTGYVVKELLKAYPNAHCTLIDLSPRLHEFKKQVLAQFKTQTEYIAGNIEEIEFEPESFDLIICNEMIGDLTAIKLWISELDNPESLKIDNKYIELIKSTRQIIKSFNPSDEFYINAGSLLLTEKIYSWLTRDGIAFVSEFGDSDRFPFLSDHLDHPEFSIHFGILKKYAEQLGFSVSYYELLDFLGFDLSVRVLSSSRGFFLSLRNLLHEHGLELEKIALTEKQFSELLSPVPGLEKKIKGVKFDSVGVRCMGLNTTDFKCLVLKKA